MSVDLFRKTVQRAHCYQIVDLGTLRSIAWLCLTQEDVMLPEVDVDEDFRQRPAYQEGYLTDQSVASTASSKRFCYGAAVCFRGAHLRR